MPILEFRDERNRYEWVGSYEDRLLAKNAGFRWDGLNKVWYTYEESTAYKLREYMVNREPEEIDLSDPDVAASYAIDSGFYPPAPEGLSYRNYQRAGIAYMSQRYSALLADPMGSGKTVMIAGTLNALHETDNTGRILIVAPASLTINWKRELEKWLVWKPTIHVFDGSKSKKFDISTFKPDISIFSYERLCTTYKNFYTFIKDKSSGQVYGRIDPSVAHIYGTVVLDEAHYCKSETSKRTFVALSFAAGAHHRYFLSGTPILNRPIEAWPLLHCLRPDIWGNRDKYATYFCDRKLKTIYYKTREGVVRNKAVWDESGACNIEELNHMLRKHVMIRREKSTILKELPPKMIQTISLPVHCEDVAKEFDIWNRLVAKYGEEEAVSRLLGNSLGVGDMGEMANIRQRVALAKVPHVVDFVKDIIENTDEQKVIVMAHHRAVVDALMEGLVDYRPVKVVGGMTAENKQMSVDLFQKDVDTKVFIGNIRAAGVGLTLTASSTVVFAELDFTPGMMEQASDRAHRLGQTNTVNVYQLILDGSLDGYLLEMLKTKKDVFSKLMR